MPAVRLRMTGTVQGVFFRASAKERADALGIAGWVRNTPDGAVELHAEGPEDALRAFQDWCAKGPPAARVTGLTSTVVSEEHATTFAILR